MGMIHKPAARTLIWLAAMTLPFQGLSVASCGCDRANCCQNDEQPGGCCCSTDQVHEERCCCAGNRAASTESCCAAVGQHPVSRCCCQSHGGQGTACRCGPDCQCGKSGQPTPTVPPAESKSPDKVVNGLVSAAAVATVSRPQITRQHHDPSPASNALAALDRCISLCRFTL